MARHREIQYEQAVYGSFPFWDRGYAILAHSPGCRPEWLAGLRAACQRFGERPAGASEAPALFALPLDAGPWLVVGVGPQGRDDRGRPGALAFHALFLDPHEYRKAGGNPFDFAPILRNDWTAETAAQALPSGVRAVEPAEPSPPPAGTQAESIAAILVRGGRVALQTPEPIDAVARQVWNALPVSVRCRASVATWAFGNGNQFDLVALPRLAGVELDASYVDPTQVDPSPERQAFGPAELPSNRFAARLKAAMPILGGAALLLGAGLGLALRPGDPEQTVPSASSTSHPRIDATLDRPPPEVADYRTETSTPEEKREVTEGLIDLAERFGAIDAGDPVRDDPAALMVTLARRLRYRGPWLSSTELAELESEAGPGSGSGPGAARDRTQALEWHTRTRRFAADRVLPAGFRDGPLRWQLDTLAWSFHLDDQARTRRRSPAEIPHALADTLAVDVSLVPNPLAARHPALAAYREFLSRLPRR